MASPHRGEVQLKAGEKTYKLLFGTTAQCAIELKLGISFSDIGQKLETIHGLRGVLWACLLKNHDDFPKPEDLDDLMDEVGLHAVRDALVEAINLVVLKPAAGAKSKNG